MISAAIFAVLFCVQPAGQAQNLNRPNIVLLMADDMGLGDTSAYQDFTGNSDHDQIHTPAMEQLSRMGVRFTDAHAPSSRCSPTRYGLLTGRYPWRNRLKHWVLFGAQGDPMIEADRPTIATLLRDNGYHTGMVGKWHVGLRYRQIDGRPAAGFADADLKHPLFDSPMDHGFDFCRFTSRSHGTSGPTPGRKNRPNQTVGPGHIHGRSAIGATEHGRQISDSGESAYVLSELGGRHSDSALEFLTDHVSGPATHTRPFFLYYPSNSNHAPHTSDTHVGDKPVAGAGRMVDGEPADTRGDYIYENDAALGRLMEWLSHMPDPRSKVKRALIENTIVIFTSDNGAEKNSNVATGPFRSNKGSCYEGGHRVPFLVSWPAGSIGDGNPATNGDDCDQLLGLTDMFATFAEILNVRLPDNATGEKGAEDSVSMVAAMQGQPGFDRPLFFNDHKETKDHAAAALRLDNPVIEDVEYPGQWKLFLHAQLLRTGVVHPMEFYELQSDSAEEVNLISNANLQALVRHLSDVALLHRTSGGHRLADVASSQRMTYQWQRAAIPPTNDDHRIVDLTQAFFNASVENQSVDAGSIRMTVVGVASGRTSDAKFSLNERGLGISSGDVLQIDEGEAILFTFDQDVIVESMALVAGNGVCGGFYQVGKNAPLAVYCVDDDIDAQDQSGILSDIGVVRAGQTLRVDSQPHLGVETAGRWRLASLTVRPLRNTKPNPRARF